MYSQYLTKGVHIVEVLFFFHFLGVLIHFIPLLKSMFILSIKYTRGLKYFFINDSKTCHVFFFGCCYLREISLIRITKEVLILLKSAASLFVYPDLLWNNLNYIPSPCVYVMLTVRSSCDRSSCRRLAMLSAVPWRELVQLNDVALPFGHTAL